MNKIIERKVIKGVIYKRCSHCLKYLPLSAYCFFEGNGIDKTQGNCKECSVEIMRRWRYNQKIRKETNHEV